MDDESLARMERILLATWPSLETEERGGWVAGFNGGFTGRANSVTVVRRTEHAALDELCVWVEGWYRTRGAVPAYRITPLSTDVGEALTTRGYRWWRNGASVMTGELDALAGLVTPDPYESSCAPTADESWYRLSGHDERAEAVLTEMFDGISPPSLHVTLRHGDETSAIGRGVLHDGHLAIFGMETAVDHRRRGLASAVIGHLARWAIERGADRATLQVETGNDGAHALYERLGFGDRYEYSYVALER